MTNYAILCYDTFNIGDEIQSLAMKRLLPRVDYYIQRDNYNIVYDKNYIKVNPSGLSAHSVKLFVNGWFDKSLSLPSYIDPKVIAMHMTKEFLNNVALSYWKTLSIGCRDKHTYDTLQKKGISSVLIGCPTVTFPRYNGIRDNNIYYVDVSDVNFNKYKEQLDPQGKYTHTRITHIYRTKRTLQERFTQAQALLSKYEKAHYVVTSRLHCLLPCRGFSTPVIFTDGNNDPRFDGLVNEDHNLIANIVKERVSLLLGNN